MIKRFIALAAVLACMAGLLAEDVLVKTQIGESGFNLFTFSDDEIEIKEAGRGFADQESVNYTFFAFDSGALILGVYVDFKNGYSSEYLSAADFIGLKSADYEEFRPARKDVMPSLSVFSRTTFFHDYTFFEGVPRVTAVTDFFDEQNSHWRAYSEIFMYNGDLVYFRIIGQEFVDSLLRSLSDANVNQYDPFADIFSQAE